MWNQVEFCLTWHFHFQHFFFFCKWEEGGRVQDPASHSITGYYFNSHKGTSEDTGVQIYYGFASPKGSESFMRYLLDCCMEFQRGANFQHFQVFFRIKSKALQSPNHHFQVKQTNKTKILLRTWKYLNGKPSHKCLRLSSFPRNRRVQTGLLIS